MMDGGFNVIHNRLKGLATAMVLGMTVKNHLGLAQQQGLHESRFSRSP